MDDIDMDIDQNEILDDLLELKYITEEEKEFFLSKYAKFVPDKNLAIWIKTTMIIFKWIRIEMNKLTERIEELEKGKN